MLPRAIADSLRADLEQKVVLLAGPRQAGKTTLSRALFGDTLVLSYDRPQDRAMLRRQGWRRDAELVVFDELHKMPSWKRWLKGVYDAEGTSPKLLVTGSARLDTYRRAGDSLAGRYFLHRLHPFDVKEAILTMPATEAFERILRVGGFPEPFVKGTETFAKRWRRTHVEVIIRQDLRDLETVRSIGHVERIVELLRVRVGSSVSYANLARDLEVDAKTVKRYLELLESLYVVFRVTPYHRNIARALLKEPKFYFYDVGQVEGDSGAKFENLVACTLRKELDRIEDSQGERTALHYLRTKDGREIDFVVMVGKVPRRIIECKWSDESPTPHLGYFAEAFPHAVREQVVGTLKRDRSLPSGVAIRSAAGWLSTLDLMTD